MVEQILQPADVYTASKMKKRNFAVAPKPTRIVATEVDNVLKTKPYPFATI